MTAINAFLLANRIRIAANPCVSPDFCLDWPHFQMRLKREASPHATITLRHYHKSKFATGVGSFMLVEDEHGDHAWLLDADASQGAEKLVGVLDEGVVLSGRRCAFPATWTNLLKLKNLAQTHDGGCTIFPTATGSLAHSSIGVGARFTTLHWPAVEWVMAHLGTSLTANQNSIPRELVFDVDAMLKGTLDSVPFPFIGGNVPEGHQGQSVEGMSHGAVLSKLKHGFHLRRIAWGFNADHQPVGGKFDAREDRLVSGSLLASYITFDLSPELAITVPPASAAAWCAAEIGAPLIASVRARVAKAGVTLDDGQFFTLLAAVWPAVRKMQIRDGKYAAARKAAFSTDAGRTYFRELSIDDSCPA